MRSDFPAEADDIQGLVWSGYGPLTEASFLLLQIVEPQAARLWLRQVPVTTAAQLTQRQDQALQVAISAAGLSGLGISDAVINGFSPEFLAGMAGDESRSRRLGDVGPNSPSSWRWGGGGEPDLLLLLYAAEGQLAEWQNAVADELSSNGFELTGALGTSNMGGKEPFGFADGVSQPKIDWRSTRTPGTAADLDYGNLISTGEFLLGYRNEYALYTERPLLAAEDAPGLPEAEDQPGLRDLGRNGTYLVFRELHQDVRSFWQFAARASGDSGAEALAQEMVGRRRSGEPLVSAMSTPIPGVGPDRKDISENQFTFDGDRSGLQCPFGAHIRRANPRTGDLPGGQKGLIARLMLTLGLGKQDLSSDLVASSRFHRILRRGREFGRWIDPEAAMQPTTSDPQSGLHFICLNANIARQFEFIQNAWLASAKFSGLSGESDPLTGNREAFPPGCSTDGFSRPQATGLNERLGGLPRFATVRGGGYFFLPGVRALRFLAR
jgi:Dyp-type peroxidase family